MSVDGVGGLKLLKPTNLRAVATATAGASDPTGRADAQRLRAYPTDSCAVCGISGAGADRNDRKATKSSAKLMRCMGCMDVKYCSRQCQKEHWAAGGHKFECGKIRVSAMHEGMSSDERALVAAASALNSTGKHAITDGGHFATDTEAYGNMSRKDFEAKINAEEVETRAKIKASKAAKAAGTFMYMPYFVLDPADEALYTRRQITERLSVLQSAHEVR